VVLQQLALKFGISPAKVINPDGRIGKDHPAFVFLRGM
jgi:hypothetical protein